MTEPAAPLPIAGVRVAAAAAGIRYRDRPDLALLALDDGAQTAAVFTRNRFRAAPVVVAAAHLAAGAPRYLLINAGNANAGLGADGERDAAACCDALAARAGVEARQVLPFSTGVIGEPLPVARLTKALPALLDALAPDGWPAAARAIMTTDTRPKCASRTLETARGPVALTGIAKGAGMICPDMATMLAFIASDIACDRDTTAGLLRAAVADSFNAITVDGDTSTNDACTFSASGAGGVAWDALAPRDRAAFEDALGAVAGELAQAIVRDAEGATRFVTIQVEGAPSRAAARAAALTVAHSPLVKTALYAGDPNWGRIVAALGRAPLDFDIARLRCYIGDCPVFIDGARPHDYSEARAARAMAGGEITLRIVFGAGDAPGGGSDGERYTMFTSDLSEDYVKINADYRS